MILAALVSVASSTGFAATTAYDGTYDVDGTTEQGDCVRSVRGQLTIEGGHVAAISDGDTAANGLIDDSGTVSFVFRRGQELVHAAGYMKGRNGSGSWSSNTSYCGGRWRAKKMN